MYIYPPSGYYWYTQPLQGIHKIQSIPIVQSRIPDIAARLELGCLLAGCLEFNVLRVAMVFSIVLGTTVRLFGGSQKSAQRASQRLLEATPRPHLSRPPCPPYSNRCQSGRPNEKGMVAIRGIDPRYLDHQSADFASPISIPIWTIHQTPQAPRASKRGSVRLL